MKEGGKENTQRRKSPYERISQKKLLLVEGFCLYLKEGNKLINV